MSKFFCNSVIGGAFALLALASLSSAAEGVPSPSAVMKAMVAAGQPGAEHQKLQPLIGDWTFTLKMWTDPSQPPAELKGTVVRKWVLGNRFVQESVSGECDGQPFEGQGMWGYDSAQKKYTITRACGLCAKSSSHLATLDPSGKKFECLTEEVCPLNGQPVKGRDEIVLESNDRIVVNVYKQFDGKEVKVMELVNVRKK